MRIVWTVGLLWAHVAVLAVAEDTPKPMAIGSPAVDFALPAVDGKSYSLADFAESPVLVLVFTCVHCPTAQAYETRIQALADDYKDKGVAVVAISPNDPLALRLDELGYTDLGDSFDDMKQRAKDIGIRYPYLYDGETQAISRQYGPVSTPHAFVFDADRKLRYQGRIDDSEKIDKVTVHDVRNAIDAVLAGKPVPVETNRTYGCSVKWSDKRPTVQAAFEKWAQEPVSVEPIDVEGIQGLLKNDSENLRVINFWATWCGPCVAEFPELVTIHRMYRGRPFELITVSTDPIENQDNVLAFLKKQEASTRNYQFSGDDVYKLIEAVDPEWEGGIPYTLIVKPGGEIVFREMGMIDPLETKKAIVSELGRVYR